MKRFSCLMVLMLAGCLEATPKPAGESAPAVTSATPAAQPATPATATPAPAGGNIVMPGGPGGGVVTGDLGSLAAPAAPATNNATPTPVAPVDPKAALGKQPAKLVDLNEAKKNPKIVVVTGKIMADDPLNAAMQAYFSIPARAQIANFQNQLRISKELNDGKPLNHGQFMELVQQLRIEFLPLPPWQMLGYDSKTGDIVVLEDKGEKIRLFKEKNIPIEDGDKQYE